SQPMLSTNSNYVLESQSRNTTTHYDKIGRVSSIAEELGVLDGTTSGASSTLTITNTRYDGATTTIKRRVNGELRTRIETKNVLGKVAAVTDANNVTMSFTYDADGNLTDTAAPAEVCNPTGTNNNIVHL